MMKKILALSLPLLLAGCGVRSHNVTFTWSFEGGRTCAASGVATMVVQVAPGQALQNNGVFACNPGGGAADGITLLKFAPGTYTYQLDAEDSGGNVLYETTGSFTVNGDTLVHVDFPYSGANVDWSFAQATGSPPACGAGFDMDTVEVDVDNKAVGVYDCAAGLIGKGQGVSTPYVSAGTHALQLFAYNQKDANTVYAQTPVVQFTVTPGQPTANTLTFQWQIGGLFVQFSDVANQASNACSADGLTNATINFERASDHSVLFANGGDVQPACSSTTGGFNEIDYPILPPDSYLVHYAGRVGNGTYREAQPTTVNITAGDFGAVGSPLHVPISLQQ